MPVFAYIRGTLKGFGRHLIPEVIVSALTAILLIVLVPGMARPLPPMERGRAGQATAQPRPNEREREEALAVFMERIALSHVAALRDPHWGQGKAVAVVEARPGAAIPLPPARPSSAARSGGPAANAAANTGQSTPMFASAPAARLASAEGAAERKLPPQ